MEKMLLKKEFPLIHYYDQDLVDIYEWTWAWMNDFWYKVDPTTGIKNPSYVYKGDKELSLYECCLSSFFLVYFNRKYPVGPMLDNFYALQEESGAIRGRYSLIEGKPILTETNPEGLSPPMLAWVEYNLYHKVGLKLRLKTIMPNLIAYHNWLETNFKEENGLYAPPPEVSMMPNAPRGEVKYPLDFNAQVAINALYMASLADIMNDKELGFRFKRQYFSLKTRINTLMWDPDDRIYYDLDADEKRIKVKTIAAFWTLLAKIPNDDRAEGLFRSS